jgi:hypothetical protein
MKRSLLFLFLLTTNFAFAIDNAFEKPNVAAEFKQLDRIEKIVNQSGVDYNGLILSSPDALNGIELNTTTSIASARGGDLPAGIPAIVWGFCCCVFGLALVYFQTDNDKEQVKKAAIGCAVSAVLGLGLSLLSNATGNGYYYY